ncbi:MAG: type III-A CRISPR-associated protein Csm2 [Methanobacteriaceae archaeon]
MSYDRNNYKKNRSSGNEKEGVKKVIRKIRDVNMLSDISPKDFADKDGYADLVAKDLKGLKSNQLRKFFGAVRNIELKSTWAERQSDFYLFKPKLAVAVGRGLIPEEFYQFMMVCMEKVDVDDDEKSEENFKTFVDFLEAVVAYHKYYNN